MYVYVCVCVCVCVCVVRLELGCSTDSLDRPAVYYRQASYLSISLPQLAGQRLKLAS